MGKLSALVVDDSKSARFFLRKALEEQDVDVDLVESGFDALSRVKQRRPDIVFMDHQMPEMDGLETTARLKQDPLTTAIPVVMCTSTDDAEFLRRVDEVGAMGILPKPPTPDGLQGVLTRVSDGIAVVQHQAAAMQAMRGELEGGLRSELETRIAALQEALGQRLLDGQAAAIKQPMAELEQRLKEHLSLEIDGRMASIRGEIPAPDEGQIAATVSAGILGGEALSVKIQDLVNARISSAESTRGEAANAGISHAIADLEQRIEGRFSSDLDTRLASFRDEVRPPDSATVSAQIRDEMLGDGAFLAKLRERITPDTGPDEEVPEVDVAALVSQGIATAVGGLTQQVSGQIASGVDERLTQFREQNPVPDEAAIADQVRQGILADKDFLSKLGDAVRPAPESQESVNRRTEEREALVARSVETAMAGLENRIPGLIADDFESRISKLREDLQPPDQAVVAEQVRLSVRSDATLVDEILGRVPEMSERWQRQLKGLTTQVRQAMILQMAFSGGVAAAVAAAIVYFL